MLKPTLKKYQNSQPQKEGFAFHTQATLRTRALCRTSSLNLRSELPGKQNSTWHTFRLEDRGSKFLINISGYQQDYTSLYTNMSSIFNVPPPKENFCKLIICRKIKQSNITPFIRTSVLISALARVLTFTSIINQNLIWVVILNKKSAFIYIKYKTVTASAQWMVRLHGDEETGQRRRYSDGLEIRVSVGDGAWAHQLP